MPKDGLFDDESLFQLEARPKRERPKAKFKTANPARRRMVVGYFYRIQKLRIAIGNGIQGLRRDYPAVYTEDDAQRDETRFLEPALESEKYFAGECQEIVKDEPIANWLVENIRGFGWNLAAQILGLIGEIELFPTISKLWSYAGFRPDSHRQEGEQSDHNTQLKRLMHNVVSCCLKAGGFYAGAYAYYKDREEGKRREFLGRLEDELGATGRFSARQMVQEIRTQLREEARIKAETEALELSLEEAKQRVSELREAKAPAEEISAAKDAVKAEKKRFEKERPAPFRHGKLLKAIFEGACELGFSPDEQITRKNLYRIVEASIAYLARRFEMRGVPAITAAHRHNRALRSTKKLILQHLWLKWRELQGLPVSDPYVFAIEGHDRSHLIPPPAGRDAAFPVKGAA